MLSIQASSRVAGSSPGLPLTTSAQLSSEAPERHRLHAACDLGVDLLDRGLVAFLCY
jgi:hypothetical protein